MVIDNNANVGSIAPQLGKFVCVVITRDGAVARFVVSYVV
jgi:hypothetical protein